MGLVYLWVSRYKNINNQGFNFSPKFICKYDEKKNALTIDENKEYMSIFPKNIDITAIVGENGSGKSSIIDLILKSTEEELDIKYLIVYKGWDGVLKYQSSELDIDTHLSDGMLKLERNIFVYNHNSHVHFAFRHYNIIEVDKKAIINLLTVDYGRKYHMFEISTFMYLPIQIGIKLRDSNELIEESIHFFKPADREEIRKIFDSIQDPYHQYLFICYGRERGIFSEKEVLNNIDVLKENIKNYISEKDYNKYFVKLTNEKTFNISELSEKEKNIYMRKNGYFYFFDFDMLDEIGRRFNHLSRGEQMIFGQLLNIYSVSSGNDNNLIFLFDEPEIALHPDWQKKYLNEVITLLQRLNKTYQFIFTTHSPLLLSDLPKENVIFLEKDEETGNCKNVSETVTINPFGANIHTLLSYGFFMKSGLMGEFAKSKITEIFNYLKLKDNKPLQTVEEKQIKSIIEMIGEDFLKQKLLKMYDIKFPKSNDEKIEELEAEIERLKNA